MPRTRNVTRAQWDLANVTNSTMTGDQKHDRGCESEKENEERPATRATRSQTRTRSDGNRIVLGSLAIKSKGTENTASANISKAKGKGKAKPLPPKRKKLPLQDITSQFLPAPEAANRGEENEGDILQQTVNPVNPLPLARDLGSATLGPTMSTNHPAPIHLNSPLPPSSPPSAITSSPQYPKILPKSNNSWLGLPWDVEENNIWNELDDVRPASQSNFSAISSNSDPFGFVALERKLKAERRTAAQSPLKRLHHEDESDEELGRILVADTSSPRLVRRLKRPLYQDDSTLPPALSEHPHYATPPTPHKDKKKRQRLSQEEDILNSSSSMPSTPSPSKPPTRRPAQEAEKEDALDELQYNLDGNQEVEDIFGKTKNPVGVDKGEQSKVTMTALQELLRESMDDDTDTEKKQANPKNTKAIKSKKILKKSRSAGTKKSKRERNVEKNDSDGDCAKKLERERQERVAYFKRLEGYQVQKEDVYVI